MSEMSYRIGVVLATLPILASVGCGEPPSRESRPAAGDVEVEGSIGGGGVEENRDLPLVVFLGTSITAGYGLGEEQAFPALVGGGLRQLGLPVRVVNAGVSGDTTAGGLERIDWLLRQEPDFVVVELGANDGLRGLPLEMTERNLRAIVERCRQAGAGVLLAGMRIPPNYGPDYTREFHELFLRVAEESGASLIPFLLTGVAADPALNLPDGIHPNVKGHRRIARNVLPHLERLLASRPAAAID